MPRTPFRTPVEDLIITPGDDVRGEDAAAGSPLTVRPGNSTTAGNDGADLLIFGGTNTNGVPGNTDGGHVWLTPGLGTGTGVAGLVIVGNAGTLQLTERPSVSGAPIAAGQGRVWLRNDDPNTLVFTNDDGTDTVLGNVPGYTTSADLGLIPNDSSAPVAQQNHALLQALLNDYDVSGGGEFLFGRGTFHVDTNALGPLNYPDNVTIRGVNRLASRIQGNGGTAVFEPTNGTSYSFVITDRTLNVLFENLSIWNTSSATAGGICIDARQVSNSDFRYLDFRFSETGLRLGNVAYANEFSSIQASSCGTAYHATNGSNENDFVNCRAAGVDIGFLFEDGPDASMNAITMARCTVETFTDAAVRVDHSGTAPDNFQTLRFHDCRFTSGPFGYDFVEQGAGEILDVFITGTHNDGVTDILEYTIGGNTFTSGNAAVITAMMATSGRRFTMIHAGKIWPVRYGFRDDVETFGALIAYTSLANQVSVRSNTDSVNGDLTANDISSFTNGSGNERVNFNRLRVAGPTAHVAGDYAPSAGWGAGPTITPASNSYDARGRVSVTADTPASANPTLTLTFQNGAWPTAPFVTCSRGDSLATAGEWRVTSTTTTTVVFTFIGTPVATETYVLDFVVVG